jgi:hypothetical protein
MGRQFICNKDILIFIVYCLSEFAIFSFITFTCGYQTLQGRGGVYERQLDGRNKIWVAADSMKLRWFSSER